MRRAARGFGRGSPSPCATRLPKLGFHEEYAASLPRCRICWMQHFNCPPRLRWLRVLGIQGDGAHGQGERGGKVVTLFNTVFHQARRSFAAPRIEYAVFPVHMHRIRVPLSSSPYKQSASKSEPRRAVRNKMVVPSCRVGTRRALCNKMVVPSCMSHGSQVEHIGARACRDGCYNAQEMMRS